MLKINKKNTTNFVVLNQDKRIRLKSQKDLSLFVLWSFMGKHLNTEKWIEIFIFFKEYLDYKITKMEFKMNI
ncbi:Uncharacterised protein (plasmid) [Mesomycoplasma conjunctivae]|nr:Uncharacterised protein [Mesomycoplasma conjunctivae]